MEKVAQYSKMTQNLLILFLAGLLFYSCQEQKNNASPTENIEAPKWNIERLSNKATQHLDSTQWDLTLFQQDIDTYYKYTEIFQSYPLNKSPFPVAVYDYAVSNTTFTIENNEVIFKGVCIGEYENLDSDIIIDKLCLLVLTNDAEAEETTLVDSRNYPYLTAQGMFKVQGHEFDWVFSSSPDGCSILLLNMKLFDLRFGETIIIYPQIDKSFLYEQIEDSPNDYENFDDYKASIINHPKVKHQMNSERNIK